MLREKSLSKGRNPTRVRVLKGLWHDYHSLVEWYQFDRWLDRQFKSNPAFGKRDRKWYSQYLFAGFRYAELAFEVLGEKKSQNSWSVKDFKDRFLRNNSEEFWGLIELRAGFEEPAFEDISSPYEEQMLKHKNNVMLWAGIPQLWDKSLSERARASEWSEDDKNDFVIKLGDKSPLWIRLSHLDKKENLKKELAAENIKIIEDDNEALALEGNKSLYALKSFLEGSFEIQDWASQQILKIVDFKGIKRAWDTCAGAGGKSLQMSMLMRNKGTIYASDERLHKLEELRRRAKRDNVQNLRTLEWQGEPMVWDKFPEVKDGAFDLVFVDAPCSSSGVMRRNPELRFKINPEDLGDLNQLQLKLLQNASKDVRSGGFLCYGTCSFLVSENENVVKQFSLANSHFELVAQKMHGSPFRNADATFSALWKAK